MSFTQCLVCTHNGLLSSCLFLFRDSIDLAWIDIPQDLSLCLLVVISFCQSIYASYNEHPWSSFHLFRALHMFLRPYWSEPLCIASSRVSLFCWSVPVPIPLLVRVLLSEFFNSGRIPSVVFSLLPTLVPLSQFPVLDPERGPLSSPRAQIPVPFLFPSYFGSDSVYVFCCNTTLCTLFPSSFSNLIYFSTFK
jgi:hypothetical protein